MSQELSSFQGETPPTRAKSLKQSFKQGLARVFYYKKSTAKMAGNRNAGMIYITMLLLFAFLSTTILLPVARVSATSKEGLVSDEGVSTTQREGFNLEKRLNELGLLPEGSEPSLEKSPVPSVVYLKDAHDFDASLLKDKAKQADHIQRAKQEQEAVQLQVVGAVGHPIQVKYPTYLLGNAFMTSLTASEWRMLSELDSIDHLELALPIIPKPTSYQSKTRVKRDLLNWRDYQGAGELVAVLDSGFDVNHQDLVLSEETEPAIADEEALATIKAGKELPGKWYTRKVPYGYNYADNNDNLFEAGESHGMHVSGIAVANGRKKGQAPEAQLLAMRVFSATSPGTAAYIYNKAIEDAIVLGAKSVNMSLGSAFATLSSADASTAAAIEKARDAGVVVNISAGNSAFVNEGTSVPRADHPFYPTVGIPSLIPSSLSVASINSQYLYAANLQASGLVKDVANAAEGDPFSTTAEGDYRVLEFPYQLNGSTIPLGLDPTKFYDFEFVNYARPSDLEGRDLTGKIALIERGLITFTEKINNVQAKGAVLAMVFNSPAGGNSFIGMSVDGTTLPAVSIYRSTGLALKDGLENQSIRSLRLKEEKAQFPYEQGGLMSEFSSWGPTPEFDLKPEITAEGGHVYSTLPNNDYGEMSGTSMASPQVAGISALVQERMDKDSMFSSFSGKARGLLVKNLLMSSAVPQKHEEVFISPRQQGAGLVSAENALTTLAYATSAKPQPKPNTTLDVPTQYGDELLAKVNLGAVGDTASFKVKVTNLSSEHTLRFTPKTTIITDKLDTEDPRYVVPGTSQQIGGEIVGTELTVEPNSSKEFDVNLDITAQSADLMTKFPNGFFLEGFVRLESSDKSVQPDIGLPFIGFHGKAKADGHISSFGSLPVLEKPIYDFGTNGRITEDDDEFPQFYLMPDSASVNPFTALFTEVGDASRVAGEVNPTGNQFPRTFDKNAIYISPNGDGVFDSVSFHGVFINNYLKAGFTVEKDGEVVYTGVDSYTSTSTFGSLNFVDPQRPERGENRFTKNELWTWSGDVDAGDKADDGRYTYIFHAQGIASDAEPQLLRFPVIVDTTAPVLGTHEVQDNAANETEIAAHPTETSVFTGNVTDTGSGILEAKLIVEGEGDAQAEERPITIGEDGNIRFTFDPAKQDSYTVVFTDKAGNSYIRSLNVLRLDGEGGSPDFQFYAVEENGGDGQTPTLVTLDASNYDIEVFSDAGVKQRDVEHLAYGKSYYAVLTLKTAEYTVEQNRVEFTLTEENKHPEVVFQLVHHFTVRVIVNFDVSSGVQSFKGKKITLVAENKETHKELELPVSYIGTFLMYAPSEIPEGEWTFKLKELEEGWHVYPPTVDVTVERGQRPSVSFTLFQESGNVEPITHVDSGDLDPASVEYEAYNGRSTFDKGLTGIPAGRYIVYPKVVPEGYYVKPNVQLISLESGTTERPEFHFAQLTEETVAKVEVEEVNSAEQVGLEGAIKTVFVLTDLYGNRVTDLEHAPYGTWYLEPATYDPRMTPIEQSKRVIIDEDSPAVIKQSYEWKQLAQEQGNSNVTVHVSWDNADPMSERYEQGFTDETTSYWFELKNMVTNEVSYHALKGFRRGTSLYNIPYGYYRIRPLLVGIAAKTNVGKDTEGAENVSVWPPEQFVRVIPTDSGYSEVAEEFTYASVKLPVNFAGKETSLVEDTGNYVSPEVAEVSTKSENEVLLTGHTKDNDPSATSNAPLSLDKSPFLKLPVFQEIRLFYGLAAEVEAARQAQFGLNLSTEELVDDTEKLSANLIEQLGLSEEVQAKLASGELVLDTKGWNFTLTQQALDTELDPVTYTNFEEAFGSKFPGILYFPLSSKQVAAFKAGNLKLVHVLREGEEATADTMFSKTAAGEYLGEVTGLEEVTRLRLAENLTVEGKRQTFLVAPVFHFSEYRLVSWGPKENPVDPFDGGYIPKPTPVNPSEPYSGTWAPLFKTLDEGLAKLFTFAAPPAKDAGKDANQKDKTPATGVQEIHETPVSSGFTFVLVLLFSLVATALCVILRKPTTQKE